MAVALALMAAGTILSVGSSIYGGRQAKKQAKKKAAAMRAAAADARKAAAWDADIIRERGHSILGKQKVGYAFSGVDSSGTPQAMAVRTASKIERDVQSRLWKGEIDARNLESGADIVKDQGKAAEISGYLDAGSYAMKGAGSFGKAGGFEAVGEWWSPTQDAEARGAFQMPK